MISINVIVYLLIVENYVPYISINVKSLTARSLVFIVIYIYLMRSVNV